MERHSFRIIFGDLPETLRKLQNFHTRKLGEITVFYAVSFRANVSIYSNVSKAFTIADM